MIIPIYKWACPNCGGPISAERLAKGLPCELCLPKVPKKSDVKNIAKTLMKEGKLKGYAWLYQINIDYEDFENFFFSRTGHRFWSAQRGWARRLLMMESIEIVAPTGVGKTTLLTAYASYVAEKRGWKVLYLVPTENLAKQILSKIIEMSSLQDKVLSYYSSMSKKMKEEVLNKISTNNFKVLVVTTGFLRRRFEMLKEVSPFDLIIVDDVDSLLRQSKNIERVLELMGYSREVIELALELVVTKQKLFKAMALGLENKVEEYQKKVAELESRVRILAPAPKGQLVIASATGRPKGIKHLVFRELLGFEIGGTTDYMRNVIDSYIITDNLLSSAVEVVKALGKGGVIFVSQSLGRHVVKILVKKLEESGVKAKAALAGSRRVIELLVSGKIDVVVGVASRYGVIVRGLDLPEIIRYAVFVGVPSRRIPLEEALIHPRRLLRILLYLSDLGISWATEAGRELTRLLDKVPESTLVVSVVKGKLKAEGPLRELAELVKRYSNRSLEELVKILDEKEVVKVGTLVFVKEDKYYVYIIDAPTYLQASGRTSRLLNGVMTLGLSVIIDRYKENVVALKERLSWMAKTDFKKFNELDLKTVKKLLESSRKGKGKSVDVRTILLVVESPTKAKTIAWFWGRPSRRRFGRIVAYETSTYDEKDNTIYLITTVASRGHVYDLVVDEKDSRFGVIYNNNGVYEPVYTTVKRCLRCGHQFTEEVDRCPRCGSEAILDTKSVIDVLRKLAVEVDEVVIATDPDREGEKIGWDIALVLKPYNSNISRARFHEVTPQAVLKAIRERGPFERRLVEAQIVRRIEDRWIGFSLSGHLKSIYNKLWLGAGRVQTPVLGWIIERYLQWKESRGYLVIATLENGRRLRFFSEEKKALPDNVEVKVEEVESWRSILKPLPPFTTDSLLFEAQRRLGLPSWITMKLAQDLFETGLITYHRTDSIRVSPTGIAVARTYLEKKGLEELYEGRPWSEEGAHEAIRPTRPLDVEELERAILEGTIKVPIKLSRLHLKLYDLIFRRFVASQMRESEAVNVRVRFALDNLTSEVERPSRILRRGFTELYDPGLEPWLLNLRKGQKLKVSSLKVIKASRIRLLTPGEVVKLMKEKGIGRPSTYSKVIEANIRHGYVIVSKKRGYLVPTKTGIEVYDYLKTNFIELVSVETTRRLEEELDKIERGETAPLEVLDRLWSELERKSLVRGMGGYSIAST